MENDLDSTEQNQLLFLRWLATNHPDLYNAYVQAGNARNDLAGFWDSIGTAISGAGKVIGTVLEKAPEVLSQYVKTKQDVALIKVNLDRAKQGQAPVNQDGTPVQPAQTIPTLPTTPQGTPAPVPAGFSVPPWAWIAVGLGALFLLSRR